MFDADKTRMIKLPYGEKNNDNMLRRFHLIPERDGRTDKQTDRRTDKIAISMSRDSWRAIKPDRYDYYDITSPINNFH